MQRLRADGWSYVRIAEELHRRRINPRSGGRWNWSSVRAALSNRIREAEATKRKS